MASDQIDLTRPLPEDLPDLAARWAFRLGDALGAEVLRALTGFARSHTPGSMITVRCTRDGFTAQVTSAIVGGQPRQLTPEDMEELLAGES